jgi:hypothetical protein
MQKKIEQFVMVVSAGMLSVACGAGDEASPESLAVLGEELILPNSTYIAQYNFPQQTQEWVIDDGDNIVEASDERVADFGDPSDVPFMGRWDLQPRTNCINPGGQAKLGVYRPSTGQFFLDMNGNKRWDGTGAGNDLIVGGGIGWKTTNQTLAQPFTFRWGDQGGCRTVVGIMSTPRGTPGSANWNFDINLDGQFDQQFQKQFGGTGDIPAPILKPNGTTSMMGVARNGSQGLEWYFDFNQNGAWNGCDDDRCGQFGAGGSTVITNPEVPFLSTSPGDGSNRRFIDTDMNYHWSGAGPGADTDLTYNIPGYPRPLMFRRFF